MHHFYPKNPLGGTKKNHMSSVKYDTERKMKRVVIVENYFRNLIK